MSRSQLTERTLDVLEAVAALGSTTMPQVAGRTGLSLATTHRIMQTLRERGFLMRGSRGDYRLGSALVSLAGGLSYGDLLPALARAPLKTLSRKTRSHVHLGMWDDGMVTYLIKQTYGKARIHSCEGARLEGYCSALGKVLLGALSPEAIEAYVTDGAFIALTPATIVDPDRLREEIGMVRQRGWATDCEEIAKGLRCVAVPLKSPDGAILAAASISTVSAGAAVSDPLIHLPHLVETAAMISQQLFPAFSSAGSRTSALPRGSRAAAIGNEVIKRS